jgi:hypothetical protein
MRQIGSWRRRRRLAELGLGAEPEPLSRTEPAAAASCPVMLIRRRTFGAAAAGYSLVSNPPSTLHNWHAPACMCLGDPHSSCMSGCHCMHAGEPRQRQLLPVATIRLE